MKRLFCVPSLYFLLNIIAANLLANGFFFKATGFIIAAVTIIILSQLLFALLIRPLSLPPRRAAAAVILMLLLSAGEFFITASRFDTCGEAPEITEAKVLSVTERRYNTAALLEYNIFGQKTVLAQAYITQPLSLRAGDRINTIAATNEISPDAANPFLKQLLRQGIRYTLNLNEKNCIIEFKAETGYLERIKNGAQSLFASVFSEDTSALLSGLYFNERYRIDKRVLLDFRRAGVMHVLAASGLHVGFLASIPFFISALFLFPLNIMRAITLVLIIGYLYIAGLPVSLLRAAVMFGFLLVQRLMFNERNPYNILFWTAIFILLAMPHELYSLGFQLSFGATLALFVFLKNVTKTFAFMPKFLAGSAAITISAGIITTPIILLTLHEINYTGILGNLVAVPGIALFMGLSLASLFVSLFSPTLAGLLGFLTDKIYDTLRWLIGWFSTLPGHFTIPEETAAALLIFPCLMAIITLLPFKNRKKIQAVLLLGIMAAGNAAFIVTQDSSERAVIPIAQNGAACRIITERGRAQIIGELRGEAETKNVSDVLNKKMIRSSALFIINPDYENIRAFTRIIKQNYVDECVINTNFRLTAYMRRFFALLEQEKIRLTFKDMGST